MVDSPKTIVIIEGSFEFLKKDVSKSDYNSRNIGKVRLYQFSKWDIKIGKGRLQECKIRLKCCKVSIGILF